MNRSGQRRHFWVNFFAEGRQVDSALKVMPQERVVNAMEKESLADQ